MAGEGRLVVTVDDENLVVIPCRSVIAGAELVGLLFDVSCCPMLVACGVGCCAPGAGFVLLIEGCTDCDCPDVLLDTPEIYVGNGVRAGIICAGTFVAAGEAAGPMLCSTL